MNSEFYGFEKLSLVDYDGVVACTLFTKGCNFRCGFCHNSSLVLNEDLNSDSPNSILPIDFNYILDYLRKRKGIIEGVVITGGEPTILPNLVDKIKEIKKLGLLIKLDTNGTNPNVIKDLLSNNLIDYIAMDIKNGQTNFLKTAGISNSNYYEKVKESINIIINSNIEYEFRTTIIEEFHNEEDIIEIGLLINKAKLFVIQKYIDRDSCINHGYHEVKKEKALYYQSLLEQYVKCVNLRGY